ncbi:TPA: fimbrial protein [Klebsiella pneumoniae]
MLLPLRLVIFALAFICTAALAKQTGDAMSYSFSGRLIGVTQCKINNDKPVEVHFGKVGIAKIDKGTYVQDINYTLDCGSATSDNTVTLSIKATPALWDPKAIASSAEGLGVYILKDGEPIELNTDIKIDDPNMPTKLRAKVLKDPKVNLTEQDFTVVGTIVVEYV